MMPGAIEIHLPGLDKWQVVRNGKSLALPNIVTVQHASVLTADQNSRVCNLSIRAAARDKRERQNRESAERRDDCFHSSSAKPHPKHEVHRINCNGSLTEDKTKLSRIKQ